ncbi:uncharacterized protein P884DRAFT_267032 [Thermothelomyces heterothallicus CBS 202.75]|uniref:uncharacterized protein n=1 Tax=Thermothelomyces heterothallicus CBS 202.75 TaxID=1149848 RepID=UPI0037446423
MTCLPPGRVECWGVTGVDPAFETLDMMIVTQTGGEHSGKPCTVQYMLHGFLAFRPAYAAGLLRLRVPRGVFDPSSKAEIERPRRRVNASDQASLMHSQIHPSYRLTVVIKVNELGFFSLPPLGSFDQGCFGPAHARARTPVAMTPPVPPGPISHAQPPP